MSDDLYERYKDALRTGHVAVLRGSLEAAIEAYGRAAEIAPARALPHTSLGGVYLDLYRVDDALREFAIALGRAPRDEAALLGQAEALVAAGRRAEAALALDRVAEIQQAAGRLPEAADTIRRALELDEALDRVRRQRSMLREIRLSAGDRVEDALLARALRIRDDAPAGPSETAPVTTEALELVELVELGPASDPSSGGADGAIEVARIPVAGGEPIEGDAVAVAGAGEDRSWQPVFEEPAAAIAEPGADELLGRAEEAEDTGDESLQRELLLAAARGYAREERFDVALDVAQRLVQRVPSDVDAHLLLVEMYVARHWDGVAAEKLLLLGRLADLDDDEDTRLRLCAAAAEAFPADARLQEICA